MQFVQLFDQPIDPLWNKGVTMKFSRRTFLAGMAAATTAAVIPKRKTHARVRPDSWATLIDLTRCDGCENQGTPKCVLACRQANAHKFPEPDPAMLKDYWPQPFHEDWSTKREVTDRLTPYNWTFVQKVTLAVDEREEAVHVPRRCMHCDNPPCVKLCPFGTAKQDTDGPVHIDPTLCFGGAKCRTVCPWSVPQRQAGVGIYTHLDPMPIGGGVMFKCDLCRDRLAQGDKPACVSACPRQAIRIGRKGEIVAAARELAGQINGYIYGEKENGGTSTLYVSQLPFDAIDEALVAGVADPKRVMRLHQPENLLEKTSTLAAAALMAPVAGVVGAFAATIVKREDKKSESKPQDAVRQEEVESNEH
jgi:formate dehydrogenase iron-sulfur subunit